MAKVSSFVLSATINILELVFHRSWGWFQNRISNLLERVVFDTGNIQGGNMGIESLKSCIQYRKLSKRKFQYSINNYNTKRNRKEYSDKAAQQRAMYLVEKFHNPEGMQFYLKVAWNLSDGYIDWLAEYSLKKKNPSRYFVSVAHRQMVENA